MSDGVFWPELKAWLLAHGIDPDAEGVTEVAWRMPSAGIDSRPQCIEVTTFRQRNGKSYLDENGEVATETRVIPMRHLPAVEVIRSRPA
jgi:hypothetical protein